MRQVGTLPAERDARRLADFLLTKGIRSQIEPVESGWALWAIDEDALPLAREEVKKFLENPADPRYAQAEQQALDLRQQAEARERKARKNIVNVRGRWNTPAGIPPVTFFLVVGSLLVYMLPWLNRVVNRDGPNLQARGEIDLLTRRLMYGDPIGRGALAPRGTFVSHDIRRGEVWRLLTPIFLHFGLVHLVMNSIGTLQLGAIVERHLGPKRMLLMVLAIAALSNAAQFSRTGPGFGGMSGVAFGLFGFAWIKSEFDASAGISIDRVNVVLFLVWFVLCMTGRVGPIANAAHFVGLVIGIVCAGATPAWRRVVRRR
jgi:GlpG protein